MENIRWYEDKSCHLCGSKKKTLPCAGCKSVYYCSKEHQIDDWKSHRGSCRYYKLIQEPSKRSYLVATRKIPKGTTILRSKAIVVGPSGLQPVCLCCLRPIIYDVMSYQCEGCGWPIDVQCRQSPMHQLECSAFQKAGFHFDEKELWKDWRKEFFLPALSIVVLRALLSNKSAELLKLYREEDHGVCFNNQTTTDVLLGQVSSYIRNTLKLQQYDHDTICTLTKTMLHLSLPTSVLAETFSVFEMRYGVGIHDSDVIYMQHSCLPNVNTVETLEDPTITCVVANVDIAPGDILTINRYCHNMYASTATRQLTFMTMNLPPCTCLRCRDPAEVGLHFGSLTCQRCSATITPSLFLGWVCNMCQYVIPLNEIAHVNTEDLQLKTSKQPNDFVKFIDAHTAPKGILHPNHYVIQLAKETYCALIHKKSFKKGAAYKFGSGVMNRFHIYSKDLMAMNAKLNKHGKAIYIRWLEVHSRYIIQQWFVGNIPNEKAQESLNELMKDDMSNGMPEPLDRNTAVQHRNMVIEVTNHLLRLQNEIRIAQEED